MGESTGEQIGDGCFIVIVANRIEYVWGELNAVMIAKRVGVANPGKSVRIYKMRETHYFEPKWPKGTVPQ